MAHVVVLGSGVAALTAALELLRRGHRVTVLDRHDKPGGLSRPQGLRLCGAWHHLPALLRLLPPNDALRALRGVAPDAATMYGLTDAVSPLCGVLRPDHLVEDLRRSAPSVASGEREALARALGVVRTSCEARLTDEWERRAWGDLLPRGAGWALGLSEAWALAPAHKTSARALGASLSRALLGEGGWHRVLPATLGEGCLDPWVERLLSLGADVRLGCAPLSLHARGGRLHHVLADDGARYTLEAEFFVCALELGEAARLISDELARAAPALAELAWLAEHSVELPWLLHEPAEQARAASLRVEAGAAWVGPLWTPPSRFTREPDVGPWRVGAGLAPSEVGGRAFSQTARFYPGVDTWRRRPGASTKLPNLALAGSYARVEHDLEGFEAEAEAGRRAVNLILQRLGARSEVCPTPAASWGAARTLRERRAQATDAVRWRLGLPHAAL